MTTRETGFTIVELLTVMILTVILSAVLLQFGVAYMRQTSVIQSSASAFVERLTVSDRLRENIGMSSGLIEQNSIIDSHVPANAADPASTDHWKILYPVSNLVMGNKTDITPLLYYKKHSKDSSGNLIKNGTLYYEDEFMLYHDGPRQMLRLRTLANSSAPGNLLTTTCPTDAQTATCPEDTLLIGGISSVKFRYFSRGGNELSVTAHDVSGATPCLSTLYPYATCDGASYGVVEVLEATINLEKMPQGSLTASTKSATIIRVALRNT